SHISQPLGERAGALIYRLFRQYIERLPIPALTDVQSEHIGKLAQLLTEKAKQRYEVRQRMSHRIENDLGNSHTKLNQRLTTWWELTFQGFRAEVMKVFKHDIPLKDRDDWEALLKERIADIRRLTDEIVTLEKELNAAVYEVFGLD